jgi:hypothetical protein
MWQVYTRPTSASDLDFRTRTPQIEPLQLGCVPLLETFHGLFILFNLLNICTILHSLAYEILYAKKVDLIMV